MPGSACSMGRGARRHGAFFVELCHTQKGVLNDTPIAVHSLDEYRNPEEIQDNGAGVGWMVRFDKKTRQPSHMPDSDGRPPQVCNNCRVQNMLTKNMGMKPGFDIKQKAADGEVCTLCAPL